MHKGSVHPIARFHQLAPARRALLLRAFVAVTLSSLAVELLPFRWAVRFGAVQVRDRRSLRIEEAVWAVEAAARRIPLRTMCIEKGVALQRMLRQSGHDAGLHYGARHNGQNGALEAHVWVSVGNAIILGESEAAAFTEVARYP